MLIVLPDIVNGERGLPGMIRAGFATPTEPPATSTVEFSCGRCGAKYSQTTVMLIGKMKVDDVRDKAT